MSGYCDDSGLKWQGSYIKYWTSIHEHAWDEEDIRILYYSGNNIIVAWQWAYFGLSVRAVRS